MKKRRSSPGYLRKNRVRRSKVERAKANTRKHCQRCRKYRARSISKAKMAKGVIETLVKVASLMIALANYID